MKRTEICELIFVLAIFLAISVPVIATEIVPVNEIIELKYLQDCSLDKVSQYPVIPETYTEIALVTVDSSSLLNEIRNNNGIILGVKGKEYEIQLSPVKSVDEGANLFIKNENEVKEYDLSPKQLYYGKVSDNGEDVFFSVTENGLLGLISINNTTYNIDKIGSGILDDGRPIFIVYDSGKVIPPENARPCNDGPESYVPNPEESINKSEEDSLKKLETEFETFTGKTAEYDPQYERTNIDIIAVYDTQFKNTYSDPTWTIGYMIGLVNQGGYWAEDVFVQFTIKAYYEDSTLQNTDALLLRDEFVDDYRTIKDQQNCDLAFLFTGRNLNDDIIGISYIYNGSIESGYGLGQMVPKPGGEYTAEWAERCWVINHETGHNFGALHENSQLLPLYARAFYWERTGFPPPYQYQFTNMWSTYYGKDFMKNEFSSDSGYPAHGDYMHDNSRRINETKTVVAAYQ